MTAARREAEAGASIERAGYTTFLPQYRRRLSVRLGPDGRRIRTRGPGSVVYRPLFPLYLFVELVPGFDSRKVLTSFGVNRIVRHVPEDGIAPLAAVAAAIVEELRQACAAGVFDQAPPQPGDIVQIVDGGFSGMIAELIRVDEGGRARVMLDCVFGRRVSVDLPASALTLAERRWY